MPVENKQERTLEVLNLPPEVDQELLTLYFENRRRSGGGPLVSVEKLGDRAVVVFEEAEGEMQQYICSGDNCKNIKNKQILHFRVKLIRQSASEARCKSPQVM